MKEELLEKMKGWLEHPGRRSGGEASSILGRLEAWGIETPADVLEAVRSLLRSDEAEKLFYAVLHSVLRSEEKPPILRGDDAADAVLQIARHLEASLRQLEKQG